MERKTDKTGKLINNSKNCIRRAKKNVKDRTRFAK